MDRLFFERELCAKGIRRIAGVDEAGRGPLAGPVVAAAVILPMDWLVGGMPADLRELNDSKQLTASRREEFFERLCNDPRVEHAVAHAERELIDTINILQATHRAMNQAVAQLQPGPAHVLVDGTRVKSLRWPHTPIVKGDSLSYSIAAASILAKVTRDRIMVEAHERWPEYGFAQHKGYPTPDHLAALGRFGPCPIHRRSFAPLKRPDPELFSS